MKIISLNSCPRSGSTWLQSIFDAHPNIKSVYQPLFSYAFKNCLSNESTKTEFDQFLIDISLVDEIGSTTPRQTKKPLILK